MQGAFVFGSAIDVVEHTTGQTPLGMAAEVVDIRRSVEPSLVAIELQWTELGDGTK